MSFKIIATTDVHGSVLAHDFINSKVASKGLSRFSTFLKEQRENTEVIYVDNGDINQGTPLVSYANTNLEFNVIARALNYLKCDFISLGNHDFNYGTKFLENYILENNAKCITENIKYKGKLVGNTEIKEVDGKKLAFIGVVTDYIPNWENPKNLVDIDILDVFETVKNSVENIRDKVDYVVVVYHGGFERDIQTGEPTENLTGENVGYKMCEEIEGIDLLISGHQHRSIVGKVKNTVVAQCPDGCSSCMEIKFDNDEITAKLTDISSYEVDSELEKLFISTLDETKDWLDTVIGTCNLDNMYISNIEDAQKEKHPLAELINTIQLESTGADISACCFFECMPGFGKTLKYKDIILNYPFPNTLVLKEMTGQDVFDYITQLSNYWIVENDKITINPKFIIPKREVYNYDLLDGIEYTINVSKNKENYITDVKVKGEDLILDKKYKLVLNNYRATGGGNFGIFNKLKTLKEDTREISEVMIEYVKEREHIELTNKRNIKLKIVD